MILNKNRTKTLETLKWLINYAKQYKKLFIIDITLAGLRTGFALILPQLVKYTINEDLIKNHFRMLICCLVAIAFEQIIEAVISYFGSVVGHTMGYLIETDLRSYLFKHIQSLSFSYFDNCKIGQLVSRVTSDLKDIADDIHHCSSEFLIFILKMAGTFCLLMFTNVEFTLILFTILPLMFVLIFKFNKKFYTLLKEVRHKLGQINVKTENSLLGIKTVQAFANEELEMRKFHESNKEYLSANIKFIKTVAKFFSFTFLVYGLIYFCLSAFGVYFIKLGKLNVPNMLAYFLYINTLVQSMGLLPDLLEKFQNGITSIVRVREISDIKPEVCNAQNAVELPAVKGEIEFKSVSFFYNNLSELVLDDISFKITPGEKIAIVGVSGAGKSTLCNLIPRFYDSKSGQILIDGIDVKSVTLKSLREQIGVISQDIYLFDDSIANNIAYGKPNATQEEIEAAARYANAEEFILKLPKGYNTYVGERGEQLSGGQKQRIGIARAFLKNASILILDEATSSLDNENEAEIYHSLERLCVNKTTIIIAHRLTTIKNADRIFVLSNKKIVESGSHEDLIKAKGVYYDLYNKVK